MTNIAIEQLRHFKDKRLATIFMFGVASGFPWVMIGSALSAWLKDEGLSRSTIGFLALYSLLIRSTFYGRR